MSLSDKSVASVSHLPTIPAGTGAIRIGISPPNKTTSASLEVSKEGESKGSAEALAKGSSPLHRIDGMSSGGKDSTSCDKLSVKPFA